VQRAQDGAARCFPTPSACGPSVTTEDDAPRRDRRSDVGTARLRIDHLSHEAERIHRKAGRRREGGEGQNLEFWGFPKASTIFQSKN